MLNLGYRNWLLPYVEGTLDARRRAILESRLKYDTELTAEVENLRRVAGQLRISASADRLAVRNPHNSVWPRVESAILVRGGGGVYVPRFALAGGLAAVAAVSICWIGVDLHKSVPPAHNSVAFNMPAPVELPPATAPMVAHSEHALTGSVVKIHRMTSSPRPVEHPEQMAMADNPVRMPRQVDASPALSLVMQRRDNPAPNPPMIDRPPVIASRSEDTTTGENTSAPEMVAENDATDTPRMTNAVVENYSGDSLPSGSSLPNGLQSPFVMFPARSSDSKAAVVTGGPVVRIDVSTHVDSSLKILRTKAADLSAQSGQLPEALDAWRDAMDVDLNSTVDQNSTTSAQADETLRLLQTAGSLPEFFARMKDECNNSNRDDIAPWRILGHTAALFGSLVDRVDAWTHVTQMTEASAEDWYQLGLAEEAAGDSADAVADYDKVVDMNEPSRLIDAHLHIAALTK